MIKCISILFQIDYKNDQDLKDGHSILFSIWGEMADRGGDHAD